MRIPRLSELRRAALGLVAATLLVVGAPLHAAAQADPTDWYVNDDPRLEGPNQYWYWGQTGMGYGTNNYRYTYAIGGDAQRENWAVWDMGARIGRQELQVYVPCNHATATVTYEIQIGASSHRSEVAQLHECGQNQWTSLGEFDANGNNVTVVLADNASQHHWAQNGLVWSSIGVDAIRARCASSCGIDGRPLPPTGLSVATAPHSLDRVRVTLEWDAAVGPPVDSYRIVYSLGFLSWPFESRTTSHSVHAPVHRTYEIAVIAVNSAGESDAVRTSVTTTLEPAPMPSGDRISSADPHDYEYGFGWCPDAADRWNMVQRQCTSYVAWRLNDAGIPFHNTYDNNGAGQLPWSCTTWCGRKWGNAAQWADAARAVDIAVDQQPRRGSVAQWTTTAFGHVAYVERVEDDGNTIVISDSNGDGSCNLRTEVTIRRTDSNWPSNFIHFEQIR
ncbi:CHAP domain-containing protein [Candidatus Poriferisodalis sp.]|uniref:CHAP domain-containing protein n=1 Tax=Candidatus Poriferisodalis sp. TaxID=3101277 RepID=UPI003B024FBD